MTVARLFAPFPELRVLVEDDQFLVVDKMPGVPVHGGDEAQADDLMGRLKARDVTRGARGYFGVHQRLDKDVSGVLLFTRDPAANKGLARAIADRSIQRKYLAVVASVRSEPLPRNSGRIESGLLPVKGGRTRVVRHGGQRAITHYKVRQRRGPRALVELRIETGRKHQIRAQLADAGAPIVGDTLYGGEAAPRLMLHCESVSLSSHGRHFASEPPSYLRAAIEQPALALIEPFEPALVDAACLRWRIAEQASAFRWVNDEADLMPGVTIDVYGEHAVLSLSSPEALAHRESLARALVALGARGVYVKERVRADLRRQSPVALAPDAPDAGVPVSAPLVVHEGDMKLEVQLADGLSTGLFVDQRDNRSLVRARSGGLRVLNLFAYTCSFSVAAALGGAEQVVSVDLSKRALERGRHNFELNQLDPKNYRFVADDAMKWLARAQRRGEAFDLAIVDPPSFSSRGKGTFSVASEYVELLTRVLRVLTEQGTVLAVTNHRQTSPAKLRAMLHEAAERAGRSIRNLKDAKSGLDCPAATSGPYPSKSAWLELG